MTRAIHVTPSEFALRSSLFLRGTVGHSPAPAVLSFGYPSFPSVPASVPQWARAHSMGRVCLCNMSMGPEIRVDVIVGLLTPTPDAGEGGLNLFCKPKYKL